jgi:HlyD family secretion protein
MSTAKNKYRSGTRWLVWSGVISLFAVGGWFGYSYYIQHSAKPITVKSLSVRQGTVENTVSESGMVEYGEQRTLKSPGENLTVEQVKVAEGNRVSAGETLLLLRDREAEEQEREQIAENAQQEITLARNRQKVAEARQKLIHQEAELSKLKKPFQLGAVAESTFLDEQKQLVEAQAELRDTRAEVKKAELDVGKGQDKLLAIQQKLKDRMVNSPIDGMVLDVQAKDGDGITTDTELLTLGDDRQERVKLRLTTLNAAKVRLNQVARVSAIGPNPKTFTGRVISLHPAATAEDEKEGDSSNPFGQQSDNQNKVDTTILLNRPSETLIPGSQVNVEIVQQQRQNVVTLPIEALQRTGSQPFVWVKDDRSRAKKQPVIPGLEGLELVEVTSGLKVGEQVILPPSTETLTPDTPVKIVDDTPAQKQVK